jgi:uncharacterized damage-inducible protein DinB
MNAPAPVVRRTVLRLPDGFRSAEAALWFAALEDQRARLLKALDGIGAAELSWQPAPGMNTIGMLLAHLAVSEVHIVDVALARLPKSRVPEVIGLGTDDDGMPLPEDAAPPERFLGRELDYFLDLLRRARAHTREVTATLTDGDLVREVERPRQPDGSTRVFDPRWMLFHLVEHEAGHHAQILLLRHLYRKRSAPRP